MRRTACPWTGDRCDCPADAALITIKGKRPKRCMLPAQPPPEPKLPLQEKWHGHPCAYCERTMLRDHPQLQPTRDHVIPRHMKHLWSNGVPRIAIVCSQCNHNKGSAPLKKWLAKLQKKADPRALVVVKLLRDHDKDEKSHASTNSN